MEPAATTSGNEQAKNKQAFCHLLIRVPVATRRIGLTLVDNKMEGIVLRSDFRTRVLVVIRTHVIKGKCLNEGIYLCLLLNLQKELTTVSSALSSLD